MSTDHCSSTRGIVVCARCGATEARTGTRHVYCRPCAAARAAEVRRLSRLRHLGERRERQRTWRSENSDHVKAYNLRYYNAHSEQFAAYNREYRVAHPGWHAARQHARRAMARGSGGVFATRDLEQQAERQRHRCYWCKGKLGEQPHTDYHPDHVIPLVLGGSNWPSNIVAACPACNMAKGGKHPMEFAGVLC